MIFANHFEMIIYFLILTRMDRIEQDKFRSAGGY